MIYVWIGAPVALEVLVLARLFVGYPDPGRPLKRLGRMTHAFVRAAGDTLFPPGGELGVSAEDADVVGYMDRWFDALPAQQRTLLKLLFMALEQTPLSRLQLRRFSALPMDQRAALLERWEASPWYLKRALVVALRSTFAFAYLDHPKVHEALGMADRKACQPTPTTHLSPEERGDGALLDIADHGPEVEEVADVVVVGTGAGGAVAARELAEAGLDVVILEEGPFIRPEEVSRDCGMGMAQIMAEAGLRTMIGPAVIPTIQGKCVGGSTLPNSAILFRIPDDVLELWRDDYGVQGLTNDVLTASYERVERATRKQPCKPAELGPKNLLFAKGAEAMGIQAEPFHVAKDGCKGCGECMPSCPIGAKRSTDISHVPGAVRAGARLYVNARCDEVLAAEGGVRGVLGSFRDADGKKLGRIRIKARAAVLGGGVFGTPLILKRSGLANASGLVGRNLRAHPGGALFGVFDEEVKPWIGHTQGYGAFIDRQMKIEVLWSPLAVMAVRMPGLGHALAKNLALFKHIAVWDVVVHGTSTGRILFSQGNNPTVWFNFNQRDTDVMVRGLRLVGEMFFEAGAKRILPGIYGLPAEITSVDQLSLLEPGKIKPRQLVAAATHLFGTCRMGEDPNTSVVNSRGECHDVRNLFVVDSSVMPIGTRVNPHEPIMALSDYFTQGIIERLRSE